MTMMAQREGKWRRIESSLTEVSQYSNFNKISLKSRVTKCDPAKPCPFVPAVSEGSLRSLNQKRLITSLDLQRCRLGDS
jgi:hypothetical protein